MINSKNIRRLFLTAFVFQIVVAGLFLSSCSRPRKYKSSPGDELSESREHGGWNLPEYHEEKLDNGLRVLFVPDQRLPYVSFSVFFMVGSAHDPAEHLGLTQMVVRLLDKGAKGQNATQISDRLASLAAPVRNHVANEYSSIGASTLSRFAPDLLVQLKDIVVNPDFPEVEVRRQREQLLAELKTIQDQPGQLAQFELDPFLYQGHPYAQPAVGRPEMIAKISQSAIKQHYAQWFGPQNAYLAVIGQYSPDIMKQIRETFGTWKPSQLGQSSFEIPAWLPARAERKVIQRPGLTQSEIRIGTPGIPRNSPDYLALQVANNAFGETFGSRLMKRLRVDLGLTYGAYSYWDLHTKAGAYVISTSTRLEKTEEGISEAVRLLKELKATGLTTAELEKAKAQAIGSLPRVIETPEKLAWQLLMLRLYGVDDSYLRTFNTKVKELRLADVNAALARVLDPEMARILVITNGTPASKGEKSVSKAGDKSAAKTAMKGAQKKVSKAKVSKAPAN